MNRKKVVLAYSGGLDTSFCIKYLSIELQLDVYTAFVNVGGFSANEVSSLESKAIELGAKQHVTIDRTEEFYQKGIRYMIYGNVLRQHTYPLSVSSERIFQAIAIADYAKQIGASAVAHGSTGAGNDQVRFDLVFQVLAPELEIITPVRDLKLSRQQEIDYLSKLGYSYSWEKAKYSINQGLWGTSIGGVETLTSNGKLPEAAFPVQVEKNGREEITIGFTKGEPCELNGVSLQPVELIRKLQELAAPYGVGRDMHIGDTIVGIKGRIGFEAAAALIIIKSHQLLEKHVLAKWQQYWKDQLGSWYGMMMHEAQYLDPVMRDIEAFLESSQQNVTGTVTVVLQPYHFSVVGCSSPHDLMNSSFGDYGEENKLYTGDDVKGFTKILANQLKIYHKVNNGSK